MVGWLTRRLGRRGAFLLFLAALDAVVGYSERAPLPWGLTTRQVYQSFIDVMPINGWVAAAWTVGALCAVGAVWHPARNAAFSAAELLKVSWGAVYLCGWLNDDPGMIRGYLSAVIWFGFAFVVLLVSGWRENRP